MTDERPDGDPASLEPLIANRLAQGVTVNRAAPATASSGFGTAEEGEATELARFRAQVDAGHETDGYLPDRELDIDTEECLAIVDRFVPVWTANLGELAAPASILGDDPHRIATAIDRCGGLTAEDETAQDALDSYQMLVAALIDLQAFVPDDDAMVVRHWDSGRGRGGSAGDDDDPAATVIARIRAAQAAAVQWVRDDPSVVGNMNAMRDLEIRIGDSRRALKAVDAYRSGQTGGFTMMFIWPISAGIGALLGSFVFGPSLVVFGALAAAWLAAPAYGWAMGAVASAIDQAALTAGRAALVIPLRFLSTLAGAILLFGSPAIIAVALLALANLIGLP